MKQFLILLLSIFFTHCGKSTNANKTGNVIREGNGFDSFEINNTTANDVTKKLGTDFVTILVHDEHSVEMRYVDMGVSFYHFQHDDSQKIFSIVFSAPFKGKTSKGIVLGQSTMKDVAKLYGEPEWTTCEDCPNWTAEYDGIQFSVERDKSLPQFPLNEELHLKKKIIEIEVTNN